MEEKPRTEKRKVSEVEESEGSEGEIPSPKKVRMQEIIEDSEREEWLKL
jgi:hypothetical protein